jgi:hypothetical protein
MTIQVQCSCGKRVQTRDEETGRKVRCSSCQGLVDVPGVAEDLAAYRVEQVRRCPGCKRDWPLDTVVCIECGHNFETGRKLRTKYNIRDRILDVGIVWLGIYTRYRVFRDQRGKPFLGVSQKFLFIPLAESIYDLTTYRTIYTDFVAGHDDNPDVSFLELEGPGKRAVTIFQSSNDEQMKDLIDMIVGVGQLEIKRR